MMTMMMIMVTVVTSSVPIKRNKKKATGFNFMANIHKIKILQVSSGHS
jgi:hypothetical protein